jgi:hypothetical protein
MNTEQNAKPVTVSSGELVSLRIEALPQNFVTISQLAAVCAVIKRETPPTYSDRIFAALYGIFAG